MLTEEEEVESLPIICPVCGNRMEIKEWMSASFKNADTDPNPP